MGSVEILDTTRPLAREGQQNNKRQQETYPFLYELCMIMDEQLQLGMHIDLNFLVMNMCIGMKDKVHSYFKMARTNTIPKLLT